MYFSPVKDTDSLRIATLRGPSAVGMAAMMNGAAGFADAVVDVFDEPQRLLAEMSAGNVDFAVLPTSMTGILQKKGLDYRLAAVMIWGGLYVCGADSGIGRLEDLKGRTVSVMAGGTPPELMLRHLLRKAGMKPGADVLFDFSSAGHRSLAEAAQEGGTQLCILSEPFLSLALEKNRRLNVLIDLGQQWRKAEGTPPPVTAFFCRGSLADGRPDVADAVVSALDRSCEWVKAHPADAARIVVERGLFSSAAAVQASVPRSGFNLVRAADCADAALEYAKIINNYSIQ